MQHRQDIVILKPMRRLLAITLLLAFGSPLFVPLFAATADPDASLPACCRRHGTHHCTMRMAASAADTTPAFNAPPCPLYPTAFIPLRIVTASLAGTQPRSLQSLQIAATPAPQTTLAAQTFASTANLKRGPPTPLT
jgi:hypothetical protein